VAAVEAVQAAVEVVQAAAAVAADKLIAFVFKLK
jgi:hypothetical protein